MPAPGDNVTNSGGAIAPPAQIWANDPNTRIVVYTPGGPAALFDADPLPRRSGVLVSIGAIVGGLGIAAAFLVALLFAAMQGEVGARADLSREQAKVDALTQKLNDTSAQLALSQKERALTQEQAELQAQLRARYRARPPQDAQPVLPPSPDASELASSASAPAN